MPSSTSSSSTRAPAGPWGRTWLLTLLIATAGIGGMEWSWRQLGHRPNVVDDPVWWAIHRGRASNDDPATVVLLGKSRMQLDVDMTTLRDRLHGWTVVQLAVDGRSCVATLHDLADDPAFCGTVVASLAAEDLADGDCESQAEYVAAYRARVALTQQLDRTVGAWLQSRLVTLNPSVRLKAVMTSLLRTGALPRPWYIKTLTDRSRHADYARADLDRLLKNHHAKFDEPVSDPITPGDWLASAAALESCVERIQARGGRVVFVRFPTTGRRWEWDEGRFPRARYWDRFAAQTAAATIHFRDVPALSGFECPDTSHLDQRDAPAFTAALASELARRGVLPPRNDPAPAYARRATDRTRSR